MPKQPNVNIELEGLTFANEQRVDQVAVDEVMVKAFLSTQEITDDVLHKYVRNNVEDPLSFVRLMSFVCRDGDRIVGAIRATPIQIGKYKGFLRGPLGVLSEYRKRGIGSRLAYMSFMAIKNSGAEFVLIDAKHDWHKHLGFKKPHQHQIRYAHGGGAATDWLVHIFKNNIMENMIGKMSLRREYD
ncbi:N-acetyltransferase [Candidatus Liberibacter asiaticus]